MASETTAQDAVPSAEDEAAASRVRRDCRESEYDACTACIARALAAARAALSTARFAIHAGKAPTSLKQIAAHETAYAFDGMREAGVLTGPAPTLEELRAESGAIVATALLDRVVLASYSPWFIPGSIGWKLKDVFALPKPVACRGAQGLWTVPPDVLEQVQRQEAARG